MQESKELDNLQATRDLGWLAGILDGEGSIILGKCRRKEGYFQIYHRVCFYSTSDSIINKITKILDFNGVHYYVQPREAYGNLGTKESFTITISSSENIIKFLNLVLGHLTCKEDRAELMFKFCSLRKLHGNRILTENEKDMMDVWERDIKNPKYSKPQRLNVKHLNDEEIV